MTNVGSGTRRELLAAAGIGTGLILAGCAGPGERGEHEGEEHEAEEEISPVEDLMREHGVLDRVLLAYEECLRRLAAGEQMRPEALGACALVVRRFIEDYHEKLEEEHVFPRFEKAGQRTELVATLRAQHRAGRAVTERIQGLSVAGLGSVDGRAALIESVQHFIRMYRPHTAREDTVLFPAFRVLVPDREYEELGERFEDEEHRLFGPEGFEAIVHEVEGIERELGLDDLARFTPA